MEKNARDYFLPKKVTPKVAAVIGVIFIIIGVVSFIVALFTESQDIPIFLCVASDIVGFICLFWRKTIIMSCDEYDELVRNMIAKHGTNAREFVGLDSNEQDEIEPLFFEGYRFAGASQVRRDTKDMIWRSDLYEKVIVFFTSSEIHLYKLFLNTLTGKVTETADVLFYDDVVSVSTTNEVEKVGINSIEFISFKLISKGGNSLSIALNGNDSRQRSINDMRKLIKDKKTQS